MLKCCLSTVCPWGLVFVDLLLAPPLSHDWGHQPVEIVFRLPVSESDVWCEISPVPGRGESVILLLVSRWIIVFTFHILHYPSLVSPQMRRCHRLPSHLHFVYSQAPGLAVMSRFT